MLVISNFVMIKNRKLHMPRYILTVIFFAVSLLSYGQYFTHIDDINVDSAGIYIEDIATGEVILDVNGEKPLIPASITKVVTAATLLSNVSPLHSFVTDVVAVGNLTDGLLDGNIVVRAVGDPTVESRFFPDNLGFADSVASNMTRLGIEKITGDILFEYPECLEKPSPQGWLDEDFVWPYGAEFHAVNYADNRFRLSMPGAVCSPEVPGIKVKRVKGAKAPACFREKGSMTVELNRKAARRGSRELANPVPESTLRAVMTDVLAGSGIEITGSKVVFPDKDIAMLVYSHTSPMIYDIVRIMMQHSHNLIAEGMLLASYPGCQRTEAVRHEVERWNDCGIDVSDISIEDGSGLSRSNRITPYFMADVLAQMQECPYFGQFLDSFPVSGVSGTLKRFMCGTPLEGRLALKTGSMNGVQCYAGYMFDQSGEPSHIVVVMLNGFRESRGAIKKSVEKLLLEKLL